MFVNQLHNCHLTSTDNVGQKYRARCYLCCSCWDYQFQVPRIQWWLSAVTRVWQDLITIIWPLQQIRMHFVIFRLSLIICCYWSQNSNKKIPNNSLVCNCLVSCQHHCRYGRVFHSASLFVTINLHSTDITYDRIQRVQITQHLIF